jgi:tripartite-type tricarboxylate transporter receptor subunit TctC
MFASLTLALQYHHAGNARILAVTSSERVPALPDIPTLSELGLLGFRSDSWSAITAPPRTPAAIVAKLNAAINDVLALPEMRNHLLALSLTPVGGTPADLAALIKAETRRWGDVIRATNVSLD